MNQESNGMPARLLFMVFALALAVPCFAQPVWEPVAQGTEGTPRGHWVYQPSRYASEPSETFPVVIWLHGLGRGGDGSVGQLQRLLGTGPPSIIESTTHPLRQLFDQREVVVLAPQLTDGVWWKDHHIRAFLDWALAHYRLDPNRVWLTGQSAGASGIHHFMNNDPNAREAAAFLPVAVRGRVLPGEGDYLGEWVPYWAMTALGDASNTATRSVDQLAGFQAGVGTTNVMGSYPDPDYPHTAVFDGVNWTWRERQISAEGGLSPKLTLYPGSNHNSWDRTYNNPDVWDWLFDQVKPRAEIVAPSDGARLSTGGAIALMAEVLTWQGRALDVVAWYSSVDGYLASDLSSSASLSSGEHVLSFQIRDSGFGSTTVSVTVQVEAAGEIYSDRFEVAVAGS